MKKFSEEEIAQFVSNQLFNESIVLGRDDKIPKISIITLSLNQGRYLEKTILSVLNQNYPNLEYIVIDGGSQDDSVNIIKKYQKYITYWVSETDKGQSDGLNKGFNKATGDIVAYINSDDVYMPGILEKVAREFMEKGTIDVLYGNKLVLDPEGKILSERRLLRWMPKISIMGFFSRRGYWVYLDAAFWKREFFVKTNGFDLSLKNTMDVDYFLQLVKCKARFHFMREYFIGFRSHRDSKTILYGDERNPQETQTLFEKYYPYKWPMNKLTVCVLRIFWGCMYIVQGDGLYLFKLYNSKRRKTNA